MVREVRDEPSDAPRHGTSVPRILSRIIPWPQGEAIAKRSKRRSSRDQGGVARRQAENAGEMPGTSLIPTASRSRHCNYLNKEREHEVAVVSTLPRKPPPTPSTLF